MPWSLADSQPLGLAVSFTGPAGESGWRSEDSDPVTLGVRFQLAALGVEWTLRDSYPLSLAALPDPLGGMVLSLSLSQARIVVTGGGMSGELGETKVPVDERSAVFFTVNVEDENGQPTIPTSISWSLYDWTGLAVNGRQDVPLIPAQSVMVVLVEDDTAWLGTSDTGARSLVVRATYDSFNQMGATITKRVPLAVKHEIGAPS